MTTIRVKPVNLIEEIRQLADLRAQFYEDKKVVPDLEGSGETFEIIQEIVELHNKTGQKLCELINDTIFFLEDVRNKFEGIDLEISDKISNSGNND